MSIYENRYEWNYSNWFCFGLGVLENRIYVGGKCVNILLRGVFFRVVRRYRSRKWEKVNIR